jgi:hypothetical protein
VESPSSCLEQRSELDRLLEAADGWTRTHLQAEPGKPAVTPALIVLEESGSHFGFELDRQLAETSLRSLSPLEPGEALARLVPYQGIMRVLRDRQVRAAALITPLPGEQVGMQLADLDHEESLSAHIDRVPERDPSITRWDFAPVRWPLRLREMLRNARR